MTKNIIYIILLVLCFGIEKSTFAGGVNEVVQLRASADTVPVSTNFSVDIILGTAQNPIDSLAEFVLHIRIDTANVKVDTLFFLPNNTSFLSESSSFLPNELDGDIDISYKSNNGNRKGFGSIGEIKLVTEDDVPGVGIHVPIKIRSMLGRTADNTLVLFDPTNDTVFVIKPTGIPQFELNKYFSIYPNPTNNQLYVRNKKGLIIQAIDIIGIDGKTYQSEVVEAESINLTLGDLPSGIYLIKVSTDKGIFIDKVIKSD
ncbi:MAG: T9SS type A sorting domain-containing protein [Chitinophagales bacterium]|nr:T9SS type A sorting domain-containing protein [Chitinophagales bacterium]